MITREHLFNVLHAILLTIASGCVLAETAWPIGSLAWMLLFVGGTLYLIVRWHADTTAYRCANCGHEFEISPRRDFLSPHILNKKLLKCPGCGTRTWATGVPKHL
jgi:DNA-directed RNA polymerase subunit RPC12/RpoP